MVPTLGRFYHMASDAYEQARTRYINSVINYVSTNSSPEMHLFMLHITQFETVFSVFFLFSQLQEFEKLFQFGQKVETLLYTVQPEEVEVSFFLNILTEFVLGIVI